jgi:hypothetical protein
MSAVGNGSEETAQLHRQCEALQQEAAALQRSLSQARVLRLGLFVALLAFVIVVVLAFYRLGTRLQSEENMSALAKAAEARLAQRGDFFTRELQMLVENTGPVLSDAFSTQARKDLPQLLQSVEKEGDGLVDELSAQLTAKLDSHYQHLLDRHEKILKEEFPLVDDAVTQRRMMTNLHVAVDRLVKKYYIDQLQEETSKLYDQWSSFPAAAASASADVTTEDQFIETLLQLLSYKLTHASVAADLRPIVNPGPTPAPKKSDK